MYFFKMEKLWFWDNSITFKHAQVQTVTPLRQEGGYHLIHMHGLCTKKGVYFGLYEKHKGCIRCQKKKWLYQEKLYIISIKKRKLMVIYLDKDVLVEGER